jgi:hypothetical protein
VGWDLDAKLAHVATNPLLENVYNTKLKEAISLASCIYTLRPPHRVDDFLNVIQIGVGRAVEMKDLCSGLTHASCYGHPKRDVLSQWFEAFRRQAPMEFVSIFNPERARKRSVLYEHET